MSDLENLIAEGNRQRHSKHGNHVVLDGPEWDLLVSTLAALKAERDGAMEVLRRHDEIKDTVKSQVLASDAIKKAAHSATPRSGRGE